jgi:cellulose synthase/poly-beta-1,6-N-acetylglucosamine synthase-like glycosyltransferase
MLSLAVMLTVAALPVLAAALYLLGLTIRARRPLPLRATTGPARRFVIVVPAHNEAAGLPATLASLRGITWPATHCRVLVVADNCTDATAHVARMHGAEVLERSSATERGKGYALAAAFAHLLREPVGAWDAVVVIDADTDVEPTLLAAADLRLHAGAEALQAVYLSRRGSAPLQVVTEIGLWASHVVRGRARESLGLSVGLRGNGMILSRTTLARVPYNAYSAVEDLEYGIMLAHAGIRVGLVPETVVRGDMPSDARVVSTQRERWIGGRGAVVRDSLSPLLRAAVRQRSLMLLDLAVDLALPPLALLVLATAVATPVALLLAVAGYAVPMVLWLVAGTALVAHVVGAAVDAGLGAALPTLARVLPRYVLDKSRLALRAISAPTRTWVRTARAGEPS